MSFAQKYNNGHTNPFTLDIKEYEFTTLKDLYKSNDTHPINGFYFTKGKFGVKVVLSLPGIKKRVDLPLNMTKVFNDIVSNESAVNDIKNGKVGFIVRKYESHNKECYTIIFKDL